MRIALVNGSPRGEKGNSSIMIKRLGGLLEKEHEIMYYNINKASMEEKFCAELCHTDVLVLAFPLYVDAIPSHLFRFMMVLEEYLKKERKDICVYAIINNGFYEGHQNKIAVQILQNWCNRAKVQFGMAICQGGGEAMQSLENVPMGHGPLKNLGGAMESLISHISKKETGQSLFFNLNLARFLWKFMAHRYWEESAKINGLRKRGIKKEHKLSEVRLWQNLCNRWRKL